MRRVALAAVAFLLAAPACGDLLDPAAAVVYGRKIPVEDVQEQLDRYAASRGFEQIAAQGDRGALMRQFEQGRLSELILRAVLTPAAEERGIEITDEDVQERIDQLVDSEYEGNVAVLEERMKESGITRAQFEDVIYGQILNDSLRAAVAAGAEPAQEDVAEYYEENRRDFALRRAQHILVEDEQLATQLARRLQTASPERIDALFAKLAREHSTDEGSARKGGNLGFRPAGSYVEPFEAGLDALEEGEVSDPVQSEFGWHVIRLTGRRVAALEEVRPQLEAQLAGAAEEEAWNEFLRDLFEKADVEVNPRYGEFDEAQLQVVDPGADDVPGAEEPATEPSPTVLLPPG